MGPDNLGMSSRNSIFGMGVADGVYAMRDQGVDSGIFSSTLMERACEMVGRGHDDVFKGEDQTSHWLGA